MDPYFPSHELERYDRHGVARLPLADLPLSLDESITVSLAALNAIAPVHAVWRAGSSRAPGRIVLVSEQSKAHFSPHAEFPQEAPSELSLKLLDVPFGRYRCQKPSFSLDCRNL